VIESSIESSTLVTDASMTSKQSHDEDPNTVTTSEATIVADTADHHHYHHDVSSLEMEDEKQAEPLCNNRLVRDLFPELFCTRFGTQQSNQVVLLVALRGK
jgi:hypothetical protein